MIPAVLGTGLLCAPGCQTGRPEPMPTDAFYAPRGGVAESPLGPADQPPPHEPAGVETAPQPQVLPDDDDSPTGMDEPHRDPHPPQPTGDASQANGAYLQVPVGQYLTIGGVVAEVNGIPIYADRVLGLIESSLMAQAPRQVEQDFRNFASDQIKQATNELIAQELHFAAARRQLDSRDQSLARSAAVRWRQQQIYEAEGSVELARRRALERGSTLHEQTEDKYREYMSELFRERRIEPRIYVTANQMREYYDEHRDTRFTEPDQIRFRIIRIDPMRYDSRAEARQAAESLRERIKAGEAFSELAGTEVNDHPLLRRRQGDVGLIDRGAYAIEPVEQAAWELKPGQLSDVIEAEGVLFLVMSEERHPGRVARFHDDEVQSRIHQALRERHFQVLYEQIHRELLRDAVIRGPIDIATDSEPVEGWQHDPDMLEIAVNMAMQNYRTWQNAARAGFELRE